MPRYAFLIEYDGTPFRGWQRQKDQPSVQGAIEAALDRLEPGLEALAAAGRTDTGVHAFGQVAHVDLRKSWDPFRLAEALNYHLKPAPVAIRKAVEVGDGFHARFSAVERRYVYRILNRRAPAVLSAARVWHVQRPLDGAAMAEAARYLLGQHDFTTFRAAECQAASPVKTLDQFEVVTLETAEGTEIQCHVRARSFLHSQVRSFVGTLERVGAGAWAPEDVKAALEAADRARCGPVAPPTGLYLAGVGYEVAPF